MSSIEVILFAIQYRSNSCSKMKNLYWSGFCVIICILYFFMLKPSEAYQRISNQRWKDRTSCNHSRLVAFKEKEIITVGLFSKQFHRLSRFVDPTLFGGLLAGGLHAVTGPDHLAALIPSSMGKSGWYGAKLGALWGLGHGVSASSLGFAAFFLKGKISRKFHYFDKLSSLAEIAVGLSLVGIGLLGIKESQEIEVIPVKANASTTPSASMGKVKVHSKPAGGKKAIFANGLLHGFSWDGAPSIAPAVAMSSWRAASIYLGAYSIGTIIAMSVSAGFIGALSSKIGEISNRPDLPKKLSFFSSLFAVLIGLYWLAHSFFFHS